MNKTIAITGASGDLGKKICFDLAEKGYNLILVNRDEEKTNKLISDLKSVNSSISVKYIHCDLLDSKCVKEAALKLKELDFQVLILNAGIYNVKVKEADSGFNNIFQVNFIAQYYLARFLSSNNNHLERVVVVGSVAYKWGRLNLSDIDFSSCHKFNRIYGNSKRFLMMSLMEYFKDKNTKLVITHPGVTLTNMTNHYPKAINWFIKFGIRIVFPSNKKAITHIISGITSEHEYLEWIGPRIFNVWGKSKISKIKGVSGEEIIAISEIANEIYKSF